MDDLLWAVAQSTNVCSINRALCASTWSSESEWHVKVVGVKRWTNLRKCMGIGMTSVWVAGGRADGKSQVGSAPTEYEIDQSLELGR